jgi:hypothetical protein
MKIEGSKFLNLDICTKFMENTGVDNKQLFYHHGLITGNCFQLVKFLGTFHMGKLP